jgi:hypothetical protein
VAAQAKDAATLRAVQAALVDRNAAAAAPAATSAAAACSVAAAAAPVALRAPAEAVPAVVAVAAAGNALPPLLPQRSRLGRTTGPARLLPVPAPRGGSLPHGGHLRVEWKRHQ